MGKPVTSGIKIAVIAYQLLGLTVILPPPTLSAQGSNRYHVNSFEPVLSWATDGPKISRGVSR